jgi:hypothetical protein
MKRWRYWSMENEMAWLKCTTQRHHQASKEKELLPNWLMYVYLNPAPCSSLSRLLLRKSNRFAFVPRRLVLLLLSAAKC